MNEIAMFVLSLGAPRVPLAVSKKALFFCYEYGQVEVLDKRDRTVSYLFIMTRRHHARFVFFALFFCEVVWKTVEPTWPCCGWWPAVGLV